MKNILIASYDLEVGGVERSLINMLDNFDYKNHNIDLMLYRHQGNFMKFLSKQVSLLNEIPQYTTFRKSIWEAIKEKQYSIGLTRILSKLHAQIVGGNISEPGYYQMQLMWKYASPFLPRIDRGYDAAISYLWPHDFVANKVQARKKIAWIHTDYSIVKTNEKMDLKIWNKFDHIVAVSEACKESFLMKYRELEKKVVVIENINSPEFIRKMAKADVENPMIMDNRFKIVTVARLSHAKGIDNAIKALKVLKEKGYDNILWYVVGYGGEEAMLRDLICKNNLEDSFVLLGKKINPYPYIDASDLYVQPSRYEGKAVTVTEAKILDKPILITNYSTASSQIVDGFDGIICNLSVDGIAEGIKGLLDDHLRRALISNLKKVNHSNHFELNKLYAILGE